MKFEMTVVGETNAHGADKAFQFWQVLTLYHLLHWSKWHSWATAGPTASASNECINEDRDDYEKCKGLLGFLHLSNVSLLDTNSYVSHSWVLGVWVQLLSQSQTPNVSIRKTNETCIYPESLNSCFQCKNTTPFKHSPIWLLNGKWFQLIQCFSTLAVRSFALLHHSPIYSHDGGGCHAGR